MKPETVTSDSESSETESEDHLKFVTEGFNLKQWEDVNVPADVKELLQYISRFALDVTNQSS